MPTVRVDDSTITYSIRRSVRARRLRLVVGPGKVEAVAPVRMSTRRITAFVESRRDWLYEKTRALRERPMLGSLPRRFVSGAKVLFRGRAMRLHVERVDGGEASLRYASAFHARIPRALSDEQAESLVRELVTCWLRRRALEDARTFVRRYSSALGVAPTALRIGNQRTLWGSCSARGTVSLNWRLMAAPRPIYEYVVVHELCHLLERHHGPSFWRLVERLLPDYRARRAWLKQHGVALG